mgnify:FL=1|tara:strand:- start:745 stop:939 length:195 start_codon:yes stop_codon:yes gene_type:complete
MNSRSNSYTESNSNIPQFDMEQKEPLQQNTKPADSAAPNRFSAKKAEKFFSNLNKNSRAVEGTP